MARTKKVEEVKPLTEDEVKEVVADKSTDIAENVTNNTDEVLEYIQATNQSDSDHTLIIRDGYWSDLNGATSELVDIYFYGMNGSDSEGALEIIDKASKSPLATININENTTRLNTISTVTHILESYGIVLIVKY